MLTLTILSSATAGMAIAIGAQSSEATAAISDFSLYALIQMVNIIKHSST